MITISVCMIVKNEERILRRCLDSLKGLYDELIIVDTGSTDSTREIALSYTDKVYDFEWINDFSAARNYSFSHATCDYIYVADADEIIDEVNRGRFMALKRAMLPEIEIVEMKYVNQLENGTVYNFDEEYRPKLYKRLRTFTFIDPIHEAVRLDPVVFDSDIEIIHKPESLHAGRDIDIFEKAIARGTVLSKRLLKMYAVELMLSGDVKDFNTAAPYYEKILSVSADYEEVRICIIVLCKNALLSGNYEDVTGYADEDFALSPSSEVCTILGEYYLAIGNNLKAKECFINARDNSEPELCLVYQTDIPTKHLETL